MKYDYLIVGAGLFGATFAYLMKQRGKRCLVIDRREHLGGNVYCEEVDGIHVHKYGAHIFHTNNPEVWQFVNSIVEFNRYTNCPVANFKGKLYNLPFNMNTFYQMWGVLTPHEAQMRLEQQRQMVLRELGGREPRNLEEQARLLIGDDIYERLIKGYTEKQWGRSCEELPAFIIKRLPVRMVFDNNYFNDRFQGIPIGGYNRLIEGLLEGIETRTGVDFKEIKQQAGANHNSQFSILNSQFDKLVYTGCIDEYFDYCYGKLEYRSLRFEHERLEEANYQGNAVVNYTERSVPYTRIIEHKHFEHFGDDVYSIPSTVISREYPVEWKPGMEPYYPINDERNSALYARYKELADKEENVIFGGRLAEYKYYDMAPVIERAISVARLAG